MQYQLFERSLNDKDNVIQTILINRGITRWEEYLNLNESYCNSYSNLNNINKAVELFDKHFSQRNPIAILIDEDVDGFCSAACMYNYIKCLDDTYPVHYLLHNRNKAHGLAKMTDGDFELPKDVKLFIIPDAGVNDMKELNALVGQGVSCICLDHHDKESADIECKAIIVNNQISEKYTDKDFCGTGIVYEFLRALDDWYVCDLANNFLDLVCFANIADVMSMKDFQTRYYVNQGFENVVNKFLLAIMKAQDFSTKGVWNIFNVAWYLVPPINSLIRIGSIEDKDLLFRAFIETDEVFPYKKRGSTEFVDEDIYTRAARLCKNTKSKQDKLRDKLCAELTEQVNPEDKVAILVADNADSGIIGLSCSKLADVVGRPCIIVKDIGEGKLSGSARNCRNSVVKDFKELINSISEFDYGQGHSSAFGTQLNADKLQSAREALNKALENYHYDDTIYCDFILDADDIDSWFVKTIDDSKWLYGTGIEEPTVAVESITISAEDCSVMGQNLDAVAFMYNGIKYCKFKCPEDDELLDFASKDDNSEITLNVIGKCSMTTYGNSTTAQFIIDDYEVMI